jgi:hypothetical protein
LRIAFQLGERGTGADPAGADRLRHDAPDVEQLLGLDEPVSEEGDELRAAG